jgi:hypothetical protein
MSIRRINLFAGPGVGKSTAAAWLFARLKMVNIHSDLVREHVKEWAYEGRKISGFDQLWLFAEQIRREELLLRCGVEVLVTDSPIRLAVAYSHLYKYPFAQNLIALADMFDEMYTPLNIILKRNTSEKYCTEGRYETEEKALEADQVIRKAVIEGSINYGFFEIDAHDTEGLWALVVREVVVRYGSR